MFVTQDLEFVKIRYDICSSHVDDSTLEECQKLSLTFVHTLVSVGERIRQREES